MLREGLFKPIWPPFEDYPTNEGGNSVEKYVVEDYKNSKYYKIVTGYTSLSYLLSFFEKNKLPEECRVLILLGHEPRTEDNTKTWKAQSLPQIIKNFWIKKGISITESGGVIQMIELIKSKRIEFRYYDRLHAKIYLSEESVILGSSNFSYFGLKKRAEANVRFHSSTDQYKNINRIVDNYIQDSSSYDQEIIGLLNQLLRIIPWRDALSRAIAELLGEWMETNPDAKRLLDDLNLWPIQKSAIGQALSVLDNMGSVLIADPTGSGKTRTNAALQMALILRQHQKKEFSNDKSIVVCPPSVQDNWTQEYDRLLYRNYFLISQGILSKVTSVKYQKAMKWLESCHLLIIDEAHNFLSRDSNRSISLMNSTAEKVILSTATPINRKAEDLLRIVEMLDIDNLPDEALREYKELRRKRSLLKQEEKNRLKSHIGKFIVRRTKREINKQIEKNPLAYRNKLGKLCRYPEHNDDETEIIYSTGETDEDIKIANKINSLAENLKGLINLQNLYKWPEHEGKKEVQEKQLESRLKMAFVLAKYNVRANLRSSRAAAIEHIVGTDGATNFFNFKTEKASKSGNIVEKLRKLMVAGPPKSNYEINLPDWLTDFGSYSKACLDEINTYNEILEQIKKLGSNREHRKIEFLKGLFEKHKLILAFDSTPISLDYLKAEMDKQGTEVEIFVVTGGREDKKTKVKKMFGLGSEEKNKLALLSDAMSEGVNLQQASAMVFLDVPGVTRIAEQRIGRLDRLDSPHRMISIYWPDDHEAFALKKGERLIATMEVVDDIIGGNFKLPKGYKNSIRAKDAINDFNHYQQKEENWKDLGFALQPVMDLVGPNGLINEYDYEMMKDVTVQIKSGVSIVKANDEWAFFCIRGAVHHAPRWFYFSENQPPTTELTLICSHFRENLKEAKDIPWEMEFSKLIKNYIKEIHDNEILLLPPKKRRALLLMEEVLKKYKRKSDLGSPMNILASDLLRAFLPPAERKIGLDYSQLASFWLKIVQPLLIEKRRNAKRNQVFDLLSLKKELIDNPLDISTLKWLQDRMPVVEHLDRRIASCIIGIGSSPLKVGF